MGKLDEVFESYANSDNKTYSKEEYAEYKKNEKKQLYDIIDKRAKITISNGKELKKYLDVQSRFESYSVGNALAVTEQMPNATILKDYKGWNELGVYPKMFHKKIKILEPGESYMKDDGSVGINYNVKKMIDISQVPIKPKNKNEKYDDKILMKLFLSCNNAKLKVVDNIPNTNRKALYNLNEDVLYVARGAETPNIFYELAEGISKQEIGEDTNIEKFKNYCVSYMLCKKYNIDVSQYNFDNIPQEFNNMSSKEIKEELEPIRRTLENICARLYSYSRNIERKVNKESVR